MKNSTNFIDCAAKSLQKTGGGNSQHSLRSEGTRIFSSRVYKYTAMILMLLTLGFGQMWGANGDVLFSQDFSGATALDYTANSAVAYTSSNYSSLCGTTITSQFTTITCNAKGSCGIGINSTTGGNSKSYANKFGAYYNNTGGYWSICKTSNFTTSTAPTAIKIVMNAVFSPVSSGSNTGVQFAVGSGFSSGLTNSCPALDKCVAGFALPSNNTLRISKYATSNGNTAINGSSATLTAGTSYTYTWVINNTAETLTYKGPDDKSTTVAAGCWDLWIGTTRNLAGISQSTTGMSGTSLANLYIGSPFGKKHEFILDDITITDLSPAAASYTITYNNNGGSGSMSNSTNTVSTCTFTAPEGKEFKEWNTLSTGLGDSYDSGDAATSDLDLYAIWQNQAPKYSVTYVLNGPSGDAPTQASVAAGTEITLAAAQTWSDHTFLGWLCDIDSETKTAASAYTMTAANTTFTAQWKVNAPVISFNNGTGAVTITAAEGATIKYSLDGSDPASGTTYSESFTIDEDKTVKAVAIQSGYTNSDVASKSCVLCHEPATLTNEIARFFVPCGTTSGTYNVTNQASSTGLNTFTTNGFGSSWDFKETGWAYGKLSGNSNYIEITLNSGKFKAGDVVYGYFSTNNANNNLKLHASDGNALGEASLSGLVDGEYVRSKTLVAADIEEGGSLKFFRVESNIRVNRIIVTREPAAKHSVTYNLNDATGTTPSQDDVEEGEKFTLHDGTTGITAPANKAFAGWSDGTSTYAGGAKYTMGTSDVTLTAQWANKYTVTLVPAGGAISDATGWTYDNVSGNYTKEVATGTELALPTFTKANRTFKTWRNAIPEDVESPITVTANVTLTAVWNATVENVIYSWESPSGTVVETGGTAVTKDKDGNTVEGNGNVNATLSNVTVPYKAIMLNSGISSNAWSGNYVQITTDEAVKAGDKVKVTACTTKGDTSKKGSAQMRAGTSATSTAIFTDGNSYNDIYADGTLSPNTKTFTVPDGVNTSTLTMTRSQTATNCWVTKLQIIREVQVEEANLRTVTFNYNDGGATESTTVEVASGSKVSAPADPTWAHHRFDEWQLSGSAYDFDDPVNADITLVANWTQLYTVTYAKGKESATGTAPTQEDMAAGEKFTVAANTFTYAGHEFTTWNDGSNNYAPAAEYTMGSANVTLTAQWTTICSDRYSFHYGPQIGDWETPICFDKVGETHEWNIADFTIPDHENGEFWVGYAGATIDGKSATKAWTDDYADNNGAMILLPTTGSKVGQAVGAKGTLVIWDNSSSKNLYVGFKPDGYGISYGESSYAFAATATANVWETNLVTLPDVSTTYTMGLATATEGTYVSCAHSDAAEAISNMGVTNVGNGKKKIYLVPGSFDVENVEEKYAVYDVTNTAFDTDFMTDADGDGVYEGYVGSTCTSIVLCRMSDVATVADLESENWDGARWNQTGNIAISGTLAKKYTITSLNGYDCAYTETSIHPATGQKGKFRIWDNSGDQNWYVHFVPYFTLSYNENGGSGSMTATERSSESASTTVTVAANGFTAPAGKHFAGWAISQAHADAGTIDYAAGADYSLTADATLFAVWAKSYATSVDLKAAAAGSDTYQTVLDAHNIAYSLTNTSWDTGTDIYNGLKIKGKDSYIKFNLQQGKLLTLIVGYATNDVKIEVDDVDQSFVSSTTALSTFYYYAESADAEITVTKTANEGTASSIRSITITNPYVVTYNANGGEDVEAATFTGTALTLPGASKGTDSFLGWFTEETGGTKIGEAGDSYTPTASITLYAHWEAVSTDARLASITFSSNAGTLEPTFDPEVVNYTYTMPYPTAAIPTITGATSVNANAQSPEIVSQAAAWNETAVIRGVAQSGDKKAYNVTMKLAPKDGVSLIKVATTGGTNKTVTGAYAGEGDVSLSSSKKMDNGKYIGFTLDGTTLQAGDQINVHTSTAANTGGSHIIFYDNMTDKNELYDTEEIGGLGDNIFTINAAMVGSATAYVYRSNADAAHQWNGYVDYIEVTRAMNPVLTAISLNSVDATKGTGTTFSAELPNGTNLGTLSVDPTIIRNAAHATTPQAVITNEGAWAWGENTYRIMDKDGDYTDYTITLTEALAPAETPVIATQPAAASFCAGGSAILSAAVNDVSDGGTLSYAWFKKGSPDEAVGTNSASYTATTVGTYYVKVTNTKAGKSPVTVQSDDAAVTLNVAATITTQPTSQDYIVSGSEVTLSIVASNATGYQWYSCDDAEKTNAAAIPGEDEASYTFTCTADGYYYCVVGNACGDDIASDVVFVKLEPQGCNTIASIPTEKPYQYEQRDGSDELEWTLYGIDSDGRINGTNKFVNNAKDFNDNTVNAITDQRVGIIFEKDVEAITIYATAGSTGRTWKSDQQIRVTSDAVTESITPKPVYTNVSATRTVTTMPGQNKQYIFTSEDMLLEAGKKVWLPFSGDISIFKICYTAAPEKCAAPVLPALASKELCAGESEAWDATATVSDGGTPSYQWYNADTDEAIEGADDAAFTPSEDGNYYVIVTNSKTGYRDNSTKSATLSVEHFAAAEITTVPLNQRGEVGDVVTLTVAATGKNVVYKWYTCDEDGSNEVALDPEETEASLNVTIVADMAQWYKVKVTSDCGNAEATAKVSQFVPTAPANVTNSILWDWHSSEAGFPTASTTMSFTNTSVEELLADVDAAMPNNQYFRSDMLYGIGNIAWRNTSDGEWGFQGKQIRFKTEVAGIVRVYYRAPSNGQTCTLTIDGKPAGSRGNSWGWSEFIEVDANTTDGIIIAMSNSAGADKFTRIQKIEFLALAERRTGAYGVGDLGTICLKDECKIIGATLYELKGSDPNGYMTFDELGVEEMLEAGKPYLFEVTNPSQVSFYKAVNAEHTETAGNLKGMYGTFTDKVVNGANPDDQNIYYFSGRHIWAVKNYTVDITIPAYRCYVDIVELRNSPVQEAPAPGRRRVTLGVNGTNTATGIDEISQEQNANSQKLLINGKLFILRGEKLYDATGRLVK